MEAIKSKNIDDDKKRDNRSDNEREEYIGPARRETFEQKK